MDETVLKIAIAAFMHDIGKFADPDSINVTEKYMMDNADLYQPFYQGRHTHRHAVYTAGFIEHMRNLLPEELSRIQWGEGDSFINLAAGHHRPETPMQWIIALADRVSSGWDQDTFDPEYNFKVSWKDYQKVRLAPLVEKLKPDHPKDETLFSYCYPLQEISPANIFPGLKTELEPGDRETAKAQYLQLFDKFITALENILHRQENLELWFEHFDSLMMVYTSAIPAARAGNVVPDVSLYDHARTTAALAVAIYLYHHQTDSLNIEAIRNYGDKKFLIINGDFYGIQDFIFSSHGDIRKYRAKILRGRSLAVSLFSELAADQVCREIGLPFSSLILNAAGKFTIMAPNTPTAKEAVRRVEDRLNDWLIKVSYGQNAIGLSFREASANDFVGGNFADLWEKLVGDMERKKLARIDLNRYAGQVKGYLNSFNHDLNHPLCPFCGKRPSHPEVEGTIYVKEAGSACKFCRDQIFLGTNLVKQNRLAITTLKADLKDPQNRLLEPIFDYYQVAFLEGALKELARSRQLLKYWDLTIDPDGIVPTGITTRFISGYVPVYKDEDQHDERFLAGAKSETKKLELIAQVEPGVPKTLNHLAALARNPTEKQGVFRGIEALGILKADVDHLGLLMACGLDPKRFTLSRLATLSRQLDFYFTLYLPHLLLTDSRFRDTYTVFAGGDDLFLIGPWNRIIELVRLLQVSFADYVCQNKEIHFSAGISLHKPHTPLDHLAESAEAALKQSKEGGRKRLTVFDETATWDEVVQLNQIKATLGQWLEQEWITNAMLYRLNELIQMAGQEQRLVNYKEVHLEDLACTRWRALLTYFSERNVGKAIKGEARQEATRQVTSSVAQWLIQFGSRVKIPLWELLYNRRMGG